MNSMENIIELKSRGEAEEFLNVLRNYGDMLWQPHPVSATRSPMPRQDRAAQFAPFSALSGYESAIRETARLTERFAEPDECLKAELNHRLRLLKDRLKEQPRVEITYFVPDARKSGGAYVTVAGQVRKIDDHTHCVVMEDRTEIPMERISDISGQLFVEMGESDPS